MKAIKCILVFIFFSNFGNSQLSQKVAEKHYHNLAFVKALEYYEELAEKKNATKFQMQRTAECYALLGKSEKAKLWYDKMYSTFLHDVPNLIQYAEILKQNEKYEKANDIYSEINGLDATNEIALFHLKNLNYFKELKNNSHQFEIKLTEFNTSFDEFSVAYLDTNTVDIIFATNRAKTFLKREKSPFDNSAFLDLYVAQLSKGSEVVKHKETRSDLHDGPISFSNGGTVLYLTRNNIDGGKQKVSADKHVNLKIFIAKKIGEEWGELIEFPFNSDEYSCGHASVTSDGKMMYFISDMPGAIGKTDVFVSELKQGVWSQPKLVPGVNTKEKEMFPYISKEGVLYFSSDGRAGLGGLDIYRLNSLDGESDVINLGSPINSNRDDFGFIFNKNGDKGYLSSNRQSDSSYGGDDIYSFKVNEIIKKEFTVKGIVKEKGTDNPLPKTWVYLYDADQNKVLDSLYSEEGEFSFPDLPQGNYSITSTKPSYFQDNSIVFNPEKLSPEELEKMNLVMDKEKYWVEYTVVDGTTGEVIENATLQLENNFTKEKKSKETNLAGRLNDSLYVLSVKDSSADFNLSVTKEGYFERKIKLKEKFDKHGVVKKVITLIPVKEIDVRELCLINQIYYDLNKSAIRPDAAFELDKLVLCMKENPTMVIEIGSHTDCRGSSSYNEKLSDRRAKSCMKYVISKGIDASRIYGKGYGENKLVNDCGCEGKVKSNCSDEEHQENRRTEFNVVIK